MARFEESDEQKTQRWQSRIARKRLDLSASVEETLEDSTLLVEEEEEVEAPENPVAVSSGTPLIPPRLSLQSKQLPAIRSQASAEIMVPPALPGRGRETRTVESGNIIARVAQRLTSSLTSLERMPRTDGGITPVASFSAGERSALKSGTISGYHTSEATEHRDGKSGVFKRTTKVRLQVVPKPDMTPRPGVDASLLCDIATNPSIPAISETDARIETPHAVALREELRGSGKFEMGQADLAVANVHIAVESVVVVMLAGDPGPVVVQYISLQPTIGFTIHLSAPTKNATPFNYAIVAV